MLVAATIAIAVGGLAVVAAVLTEPAVAAPIPPTDAPVTPEDLRNPELPLAPRGYDVAAVDALLARAARTLEDEMRAPSFAPAEPPDEADPASGEELQNGGGDGAGSLHD